LWAESGRQLDTLTVTLLDSVDLGHARSPTNDSERLLFRNLFDNLVRLDCQGTVRPGLAQSWIPDSSGRGWVFTLREGTTFSASRPLSADDVAANLRLAGHLDSADQLGMDSAVALDSQRLRVTMRGARDSIPRILAGPALALIDGRVSDRHSIGGIILPATESAPLIDFQFDPNGDARDALDRGADLVVTRDPALLDYVANRSEFTVFPLPWSRTYVLFQPPGMQPIDANLQDETRRSLASDAVLASARAAEPPFWWDSAAACRTDSVSPEARLASPRIVYPADDEVARGLAERLVALARGGPQLRAAGLTAEELAASLGGGGERGYVVAIPRQTLTPCSGWVGLLRGANVQPLIDTRPHAVTRKGAPPLTVDWDGTLRVAQP
jgi:extracellular solute-binding protein (family 5)